MILNVSGTPRNCFNVMQVEATRATGFKCIDVFPADYRTFEEMYDKFRSAVEMVIVPSNNPVLANDICNTVDDDVKVVTLNVTVEVGTCKVYFPIYNPDEHL